MYANEYADAVAGFRKLYDEVTKRLTTYRSSYLFWKPHDEWLGYLIDEFDNRYKRWNKMGSSQQIVDTIGTGKPLMKLCGFAYLHIAVDLPIVIANSLPKIPINRNDARLLYLRLGLELADVYKEYRYSISDGLPLYLANRCGLFHTKPMEAFAYWVVMLRTVAWVYGEYLSESSNRSKAETTLQRNVLTAIQNATKGNWLAILANLHAPVLGLMFAFLGCSWILPNDEIQSVTVLTKPLLVFFALVFAWFSLILHHALAVARINHLGRAIYRVICEIP